MILSSNRRCSLSAYAREREPRYAGDCKPAADCVSRSLVRKLCLAAVAAVAGPAFRATHIDPVGALRSE